eukprot:5972244-Pleurochrysis_carterae.AAC.1
MEQGGLRGARRPAQRRGRCALVGRGFLGALVSGSFQAGRELEELWGDRGGSGLLYSGESTAAREIHTFQPVPNLRLGAYKRSG